VQQIKPSLVKCRERKREDQDMFKPAEIGVEHGGRVVESFSRPLQNRSGPPPRLSLLTHSSHTHRRVWSSVRLRGILAGKVIHLVKMVKLVRHGNLKLSDLVLTKILHRAGNRVHCLLELTEEFK